MPRLEDIKQFVTTLNALGHEPEILASRGESLQAVEPPEQGLSDDIKNLFQDMGTDDGDAQAGLFGGGGDSEEQDSPEPETPAEGEGPLDFSTLLDSPDEPPAAADFSGSELEELPDFDFSDFSLTDEPEAEASESVSSGEEAEEPEEVLSEVPPEDFPVEEAGAPPEEKKSAFEIPGETEGGFELSDEDFSDFQGAEPEEPESKEDFDIIEPLSEVEQLSEAEDAAEAESGETIPDEFSLGDFGKAFESAGAEGGFPAAEESTINIPEGAPEFIAAARAVKGFSLTDDEFESLRLNLSFLPLNVKIVVEEIVAEGRGDEEARIRLIRSLVKGESVRAVAGLAGRIVGKTLQIPKGYEKRTGAEYEAEKESFAYIFRENILPILKISAAASAALALLIFSGFQFVYKPLRAGYLFRQGIDRVEAEDYRSGNKFFSQAYATWPDKKWYFTYAEKFAEKHQYQLTQEKYEELLSGYDDYIHAKTGIRTERNKDKYFEKGVLAYSGFESLTMENYEKAEKILKRLLDADMYNYRGLLAAGDNYTRWADSDEERFADKYENAREAFASLLSRYGEEDEIMFRFLENFIRTDKREEVLRLKDYFQADKKLKVDPLRYAELGGYLLDKNMPEDVEDILFRAMDRDKNVPEVHYHLARYFSSKGQPRDERRALDNAMYLFGSVRPLDRRRLWRYVDSYGRSGELHYAEKRFIEAEKAFREGINRYEDGLRKTLLKKNATLGRIYERLGDIYYYESGDLEEALVQFQKAEDSRVRNPSIFYKKGYIRFGREEYSDALMEFTKTEESFPSNRNLLFAMGNANYERNNFAAAEGYYSFLADKLEADRRRVRDLLPEERSADRAVVLNLIKVYNNLGVVLYKLGERTGRKDSASKALVLWTDSSELSENYSRDPESMVRRDTKNLAYLNMRQILNPLPNYDLQIYHPLPRDLRELFF